MLGQKIYKPIETQVQCDECSKLAKWCNENNATIVDKGKYYEVVTIPPIPLTDVKATKITQLKLARDTEELSPISFGGYLWDFDEKAQMRINGAIVALGSTNTVTWTSADNEEIKGVNAEDLKGVIGSAAIRSDALHTKYRGLKELVENAEAVEDVEAVVW